MMGDGAMIYEPCKAKTQECLNCTRPKCVYDTDTTEEQRDEKRRQYYAAHRGERLAYQHEYDMTHKRPHRKKVEHNDKRRNQ